MRGRARRWTSLLLALVLIASAGCSGGGHGGGGGGPLVGPPAAITLVSGAAQSGPVGAPLAPFVVTITDANGDALANVAVTFTIVSGSGTLSAATATTDGSGRAQTVLTPGSRGTITVEVTAGSATATCTATGQPVAATIGAVSGNGQSDIVSTASAPLVVLVTDGQGVPVQGVTVTWAVSAGGGSLSATSTPTDGNGLAQTTLVLGPTPGTNTVLAAAAGASGPLGGSPVAFSLTGVSSIRLAFAVQPGATVAGSAIAPAVEVAVLDSGGNTVTNWSAPVALAVASGPNGATLSRTSSQVPSNGLATFPGLSIDTAGGYMLSATSIGAASATSTSFIVSAGAPSLLAVTGFPSPQPASVAGSVKVTATDAFGNPTASYSGTVKITSSDGSAILPANHTFGVADAGSFSFTVTLETGGSQSISAADVTTATIAGSQSGIVVEPHIASVSPGAGPLAGGGTIALSGAGFASGITVAVGGNPCPAVTFLGATSLQATTPRGTFLGPVDVDVDLAGIGSGTLAASYFYEGQEPNEDVINALPGQGDLSQMTPRCAVEPGGAIDVVWADNRNGSTNLDIYFSRSTDQGATWSPGVRLNDDAPGAFGHAAPALAVESTGAIDCVWTDYRLVDPDILFTRSTDHGVTWSANVRVTDDTTSFHSHTSPAIAIEPGDAIDCAWEDDRFVTYGINLDIFFARSTDGGATWSANVRVNDDPAGTYLHQVPALAVEPSGAIDCVWQDRRNGGYFVDIYFARSTSLGASWSANVRLNDDAAGSTYHMTPTIAVEPTNAIDCAWVDGRANAGAADIYFTRSTDGGATFSANVPLNDDPLGTADHTNPSLAAEPGGAIDCVWCDNRNNTASFSIFDPYFTRSTNGGASFSANVRMNDDPAGAHAHQNATIAAEPGGALDCVWSDSRNAFPGVVFTRSKSAGASWSTNALVDDALDVRSQLQSCVCVDGTGAIDCAWTDDRSSPGMNTSDIYFARSANLGKTWSTNVRVNDDGPGVHSHSVPTIAGEASGAIDCAWSDFRNGGPDIYFARSTDGGVTWSANKRVNDDAAGTFSHMNPALAIEPGGAIDCVWTDCRNNALYGDIYFTRSTDGGVTWSANVRLNDDPAGTHQHWNPAIAVEPGGAIDCVWTDDRNNNYNGDIYFTRSTSRGATWAANVRLNDDAAGTHQHVDPALAVEPGGAIDCVWADYRNYNFSPDIYFTRSASGGASWSANVRLNDDPAGSHSHLWPTIAVEPGGAIDCAWQDERNALSVPDVYFTRSTDAGVTWMANARLDDDPAGKFTHYGPRLAVHGDGSFTCVWSDDRLGGANYDIWSVRGWYK